jgi:hypothetical protein
MTLVKCVVTETGSTPPVHYYTPLEATVKIEGSKKPDTLTAKFPISAKVREGYQIRYIQDIVDVSYLTAIYPMQLSCLDESGFDNDPTTDAPASHFEKVTTGRFKGMYALHFSADGQGVVVNSPTIDMSKQFDIYIHFTPDQTQLQDGTDEPLLWSYRNSGTPRGLEIGITGTNGVPSGWRVFLRISNGSITNGYTGSSETVLNGTDVPTLIRVKRGQDGIIRAYVNGVEDITQSQTADLTPVSSDLIFGDSPSSTNDEFVGQIHQVRVYTGVDLSDEQHKIIRWSKPQPNTMKFAGRIWKTDNVQSSKTISAQSHSILLTKAKLGEDAASLGFIDFTEVVLTFSGGTGTLNVDNQVRGDTSGAVGTVKEFVSGNSTAGVVKLINNAEIAWTSGEALSEEGGSTDWSATMTGVPVATPYTDHIQECIDTIDNNVFTVKNIDAIVYVMDRGALDTRVEGELRFLGSFLDWMLIMMTVCNTTWYTTPRGYLIVEDDAGHATNHVFDQSASGLKYRITASEDNDTNLVNEVVLNGRDALKRRRAITTNDIRRTFRKSYKQIEDVDDLATFALKLVANLGGVPLLDADAVSKQKHVIQISTPIHHVRVNQIVNVKRKNGQNVALSGTDEDLDENERVTQIQLSYPSGKTKILTNENNIDFFDDIETETSIRDGLTDSTL